jgi:hypothetical protein
MTKSGNLAAILRNSGTEPFVYLAITTPPQDFTSAYKQAHSLRASSA